MATLNDHEKKMSNALVAAVDKAVDDVFKEFGEDPERWKKDPPMLDNIMNLQGAAQNLPFRVAECREHPDQFGAW